MSTSTSTDRSAAAGRRPALVYCIADGVRGLYIPQFFAFNFRHMKGVSGVSAETWDILEAGPYDEKYWDAWEDALNTAELQSNECVFRLYQDADLFAVESGATLNERTGEWYVEV